jgi:hypothetical protein
MVHQAVMGSVEPLISLYDPSKKSLSEVSTVGTSPIYIYLNTCITDNNEVYDEYYLDLQLQVNYEGLDETYGYLMISEALDLTRLE